MKTLLFTIILCSAQMSLAQVPLLKDVMKEMGIHFKGIAESVKAGEVKASDLVSIEKLQMISSEASLMYPVTADTEAQKLKYSELNARLINKLLLLEEKIEMALENDSADLSEISPLFFEINNIRKESHDEFKVD